MPPGRSNGGLGFGGVIGSAGRHSPRPMIVKPLLRAWHALLKVCLRPLRWPQTGAYSIVHI
jgi:hypothetical protein